jgi:hypothetical protein
VADGSKVVLSTARTGAPRERWVVEPLPLEETTLPPDALIQHVATGKYLSTHSNGSRALLEARDFASTRQIWRTEPKTAARSYHAIMMISTDPGQGITEGPLQRRGSWLSVTPSGAVVDLYDKDDGSGRQRWRFRSVATSTSAEHPYFERLYQISIDGGTGARTYLSANGAGDGVELKDVGGESSADLWRITEGPTRLNAGALVLASSTAGAQSLPKFAIDGDGGTVYRSADGPGQWLEVDLGAERRIHSVSLHKPEAADWSHVSVELTSGSCADPSRAVIASKRIAELSGGTTTFARLSLPAPVSARRLCVRSPESGGQLPIVLSDVLVRGERATRLVYGQRYPATARQSSTSGGLQAARVLDNDPQTFNHTNDGPGEWLELDLGSPRPIAMVRLRNRRDEWFFRWLEASIELKLVPCDRPGTYNVATASARPPPRTPGTSARSSTRWRRTCSPTRATLRPPPPFSPPSRQRRSLPPSRAGSSSTTWRLTARDFGAPSPCGTLATSTTCSWPRSSRAGASPARCGAPPARTPKGRFPSSASR